MRHIPIEAYLALMVFIPGCVYGLWVLARNPRRNVDLELVRSLTSVFIDVEPTYDEEVGLARELKGYTRKEIWHTYWRFVVPAFAPSLLGGQYGTHSIEAIRERFETQSTSDRFFTAALFWWLGVGAKRGLEKVLVIKVHDRVGEAPVDTGESGGRPGGRA